MKLHINSPRFKNKQSAGRIVFIDLFQERIIFDL